MRVAGRRLRAAFSLFAPYLPKRAEALRRELGRLGRVLGRVRDLDVQLLQLAAWRNDAPASEAVSFDPIEAILVRRREAERRRLIHVLDGARYDRFKTRLCAFLRRGPLRRPAIGRRPARLVAPELIGRRYHATRKAGDLLTRESSPVDFHALRIRAKRLRYALEFHQPLYDGDVAAMIESLTALQDLLGEHQDAFVAIGHLEGLAGGGRRKLPPRALFLMGTIAARYAARAEVLRRDFSKTYKKIRGRRWKALKSSLAAGAPPFAAGVAP
jgi:CHAD domain-containing protein